MTATARSLALARDANVHQGVHYLTDDCSSCHRIALALDAARREAAQVAQRFETQINCPNECGNFIADQLLAPPASEPEEGKHG